MDKPTPLATKLLPAAAPGAPQRVACAARWAAAAVLFALVFCARCSSSAAESVRSGPFELFVRPDGAGFIDEIRLDGKTIGSLDRPVGEASPGFYLSAAAKRAEQKLLALASSQEAQRAWAAPCRVTQRKNARGHREIVLENGFLRVVCVLDIGGRITELRSKLTGDNFLNDRYSSGKLPDLSKRVYLGGWEDAIDRSEGDKLWKLPYEARVQSAGPDEARVTLACEAENPLAKGLRLRVERTLTLRRGLPALSIDVSYTALDKRQSVKIMPHPEPLAGHAVDDGDVFYLSSCGELRRAPYAALKGKDLFFRLKPEQDHWAAVVDVEERVGLVHVFRGPVATLDVYLGKVGYTLEPYTRRVGGVDPGGSVTLSNLYIPCANLDGVAFADEQTVVQALLEKEVLGRNDPLKLKLAALSTARTSPQITLRPRVVSPSGEALDLGQVSFRGQALVAQPQVKQWDVSQLAGGAYLLEIDIVRDGKTVGQARVPFSKTVSRGTFCDFFLPRDPGDLFSALGITVRCKTTVSAVRRAGQGVVVAGVYDCRGQRSPFETTIAPGAEEGEFVIGHRATLNPPAGARLRALGFNVPLFVSDDDHKVYTAVGCPRRVERWRLDQNDEYYWTWLISDNRARWPLWRFGGLLIEGPQRAVVWKAGGTNVKPLIMDEAPSTPGWLDFSGPDFGLTVLLDECASKPPKGIVAHGQERLVSVYLYPPQVRPLPLASGARGLSSPAEEAGLVAGREVVHRFRLHFHRGPRPTPIKPELPDDKYRRLLRAAAQYFPRRLPGMGIPVHIGTVEEQIEKVIASGISPTDFLRDHSWWEMKNIVKNLGPGYSYDRDDHEGSVRRIIERLRSE